MAHGEQDRAAGQLLQDAVGPVMQGGGGMNPGWGGSGALVDAAWVMAHGQDPTVGLIEVDMEGTRAYERGHIPGALGWHWKTMLWDPLRREFPDPEALAARLGAAGIGNEATVVTVRSRGKDRPTFATHSTTARGRSGAAWWGRPSSAEPPRLGPSPSPATGRVRLDSLQDGVGRLLRRSRPRGLRLDARTPRSLDRLTLQGQGPARLHSFFGEWHKKLGTLAFSPKGPSRKAGKLPISLSSESLARNTVQDSSGDAVGSGPRGAH